MVRCSLLAARFSLLASRSAALLRKADSSNIVYPYSNAQQCEVTALAPGHLAKSEERTANSV